MPSTGFRPRCTRKEARSSNDSCARAATGSRKPPAISTGCWRRGWTCAGRRARRSRSTGYRVAISRPLPRVSGARAQLTRYGFGFDPFSSQMNFAAAWATGVNRPRLEYTAQLRTRSPITGIVYLAYSGIELVNYYGRGNETVIDQARSNAGFY